jgi:hypothetical protein
LRAPRERVAFAVVLTVCGGTVSAPAQSLASSTRTNTVHMGQKVSGACAYVSACPCPATAPPWPTDSWQPRPRCGTSRPLCSLSEGRAPGTDELQQAKVVWCVRACARVRACVRACALWRTMQCGRSRANFELIASADARLHPSWMQTHDPAGWQLYPSSWPGGNAILPGGSVI